MKQKRLVNVRDEPEQSVPFGQKRAIQLGSTHNFADVQRELALFEQLANAASRSHDDVNAFAELGDLVGLRIAAATQRNPKLKPRFVAKRVI